MAAGFVRAQRQRAFVKIAVTGPSGSGKTYSSLRLAFGLDGPVAVIDTENESAALYADIGEYDTLCIHAPFTVQKYVDAIRMAVDAGYRVLIIDSLSHVWAAEGGLLAQKDATDQRGGNSYTNWAQITKQHEALKAAILQAPIHVLATMRSKQDYIVEQDSRGKSAPRKVGLAPVQREGMEYEFTVVFDIDMTHQSSTSKDRTGLFTDEIGQITEGHGKRLKEWLDGAASQTVEADIGQPPAVRNGRARANEPNLTAIHNQIVLILEDLRDPWLATALQARRDLGVKSVKDMDITQAQGFLENLRGLAQEQAAGDQETDPFALLDVEPQADDAVPSGIKG